ncbi:MAG TPA: E2 domain-containing protein [Beijerinckiaceae bacterium]|jgi:hypothetical protein
MTAGVLALLIQTASEHHAVVLEEGKDSAIFSVGLPRPSGAPGPAYRIRASVVGSSASAKEDVPSRLPKACPERHINLDGSFCLYWAEAEPLPILSADDARTWWGKLLTFLQRQENVRSLRRWPGKSDARAHGPTAARYQLITERAAATLGETFASRLKDGRFATLRRSGNGRLRIQLLLDRRRFLTLRVPEKKIMTLRAACKCDRATRLPLRACGSHAEVFATFIEALQGWQDAEDEFFKSLAQSGLKCCGTVDDCPLAGANLNAAEKLAA